MPEAEVSGMRHPDVPEALDGWHILHRMFHFERRGFDGLTPAERQSIAREATAALTPLHEDEGSDCAVAALLGHKADLMLTHYARTFDELAAAQMAVDRLALSAFLQPAGSYLSVLELGLYEATAKFHATLAERGLKAHSPEWTAGFDALLGEQARHPRNASRLWAKIPPRR